jgi:hypothetical protein
MRRVSATWTPRGARRVLRNAVIHAGGAVQIAVTCDDHRVRIAVHDTGPGRPHIRAGNSSSGGRTPHRRPTERPMGIPADAHRPNSSGPSCRGCSAAGSSEAVRTRVPCARRMTPEPMPRQHLTPPGSTPRLPHTPADQRPHAPRRHRGAPAPCTSPDSRTPSIANNAAERSGRSPGNAGWRTVLPNVPRRRSGARRLPHPHAERQLRRVSGATRCCRPALTPGTQVDDRLLRLHGVLMQERHGGRSVAVVLAVSSFLTCGNDGGANREYLSEDDEVGLPAMAPWKEPRTHWKRWCAAIFRQPST